MVNDDYSLIKKFANKILADICIPTYSDLENINLENMNEVLISIFHSYEQEKIDYLTFVNMGEALNEYLIRKFGKHNVSASSSELNKYNLLSLGIEEITLYSEFEDSDYRSIGLAAINYMSPSASFFIFPKDVPFFIEFLKTPRGQEIEAHKKINDYMAKYYNERLDEAREKGYVSLKGTSN